MTLVECEICGEPYEDHPLAMAPHVCDACGGDLEESDRDSDDGEDWFV